MATKIGSNFDYKGPLFLDSRQGIAKERLDLRRWDILVPEGFLTFVEGCWYIYDPSREEDPETGKFHRFFAEGLEGNFENVTLSQKALAEEFNDVRTYISDVEDLIQLPKINIETGGGHYEIGERVLPAISWTVTKGKNTVTPDICLVNGSPDGISPEKDRYISYTPITTTTMYDILVQVKNGTAETRVDYIFSPRRFYGVSEEKVLTSTSVTELEFNDLETNVNLPETRFDCDGGKYPWFCIPTSFLTDISNHVGCWVNGVLISDTVSYEINVENAFGVVTKYTCFRLGYIQTGNILMEFK